MSVTTVGDLAQSFITRRANARLNREISNLGVELTTGIRSDPRSAVTGDAGMVSGIDRAITRLAGFTSAAREMGARAALVQTTLTSVQDQVARVVPIALEGGTEIGYTMADSAALEAGQAFEGIVSKINTTSAGRYHFSGTATGTQPLRDADAIMGDLRALVSAAPDAAAMITVIDDYFGPGGAFETTDYQGSGTDLAAVEVGEGISVSTGMRADDASLRATLAGLAKAALAGEGGFPASSAERRAVLAAGATQLQNADAALTAKRAETGVAEARIETARTRNSNEDLALQQARLDLIGIDPYETASRLQQTQLQLETLYTMTARLSRLSLTNYL